MNREEKRMMHKEKHKQIQTSPPRPPFTYVSVSFLHTCVCVCELDHMSNQEVCGDLDKQRCFSLERQNCDTSKTPRARFAVLSPFSFHFVSSLFFLFLSLSALLSSVKEDRALTFTQYPSSFPSCSEDWLQMV